MEAVYICWRSFIDNRLWLCMRSEPVLDLLNLIYAIPIVYCLLSTLLSNLVESVASKALLIEVTKVPHAR